ncbi:MAG: prolipoprotein diacylglyceryl transferase [Alphaproteobacteria bacterium]
MPYIHNLNPIAFSLFGWQVYWYGVAYLLGFLFCRYWLPHCYQATLLAQKKSRQYHLSSTAWDDFLFIGILATLIGGRLGYILFYHPIEFLTLPFFQWWQWLAIWQGGMAFHGAAIGLLIASLWFAKRKKIDRWILIDSFCRAVPLALLIGRSANFINGELIGRPIASPVWQSTIGVIFPHIDQTIRHPSQLYEAFFEGLLLFCILHFLAIYKNSQTSLPIKFLPNGIIFSCFLFFYGGFRFVIEFFRAPMDGFIGIFTIGQFWCAMMMIMGLSFYMARVYKKL